jgi:hypothetical protein
MKPYSSKQDLVASLNNILNNFVLGLVLSRNDTALLAKSILGHTAQFQSDTGAIEEIDLTPLAQNLDMVKDKQILIEEFEKGLKRAMLRETHEAIMGYCESTSQIDKYKATPFFHFARILRNITSHKSGSVLNLWPRDLEKKGVVQVTWRSRTLCQAGVGKPVNCGHYDAILLIKDQTQFVCSELD